MKEFKDIKKFEDIDTYYNISSLVEEIFVDRVEAHKHLVSANKEIEQLKKELIDLQNRFDNLMEAHKICDEENEQLNNINDKLEELLLNELVICPIDQHNTIQKIYKRLKELKEGK